MIWVAIIAIAVAIVAVTASLLAGRIPAQGVPRPTRDLRTAQLPSDFTASDLDDLAFDVAPRGYRMDEVDAVLAQLRTRLREHETPK